MAIVVLGGATCLREAAFSLRSHFGEVGPAEGGEMARLQILKEVH